MMPIFNKFIFKMNSDFGFSPKSHLITDNSIKINGKHTLANPVIEVAPEALSYRALRPFENNNL
jgi:hypothetical protein